MKITTLGAAGEVTGSCYLVETGQARVLVDYGMHQGGREEWQHNWVPLPLDCPRLDAVVVTHAHIDHIGRLPLLTKCGYAGPIYATPATCELAGIMLRDSANIQMMDAERATQRRERMGLPPVLPLYTSEDVEPVLKLLRAVAYDEAREVARGVSVKWVDAGHIMGSSSLEMKVGAMGPGPPKTIAFSGDIGPKGTPLLRDPTPLHKADVVFMESTYGDRDHRSLPETVEEFAQIVKTAVWERQRVLIPAFAVGRMQTLVYHIAQLVRGGRVPRFPVYVDSPMASLAFEVYKRHAALYDADAAAIFDAGHQPLFMPDLEIIKSSQESKRLNTMPGAMVIMAASGMCTGGRILHHLRHNLWKRDTQLAIVGYQAAGTLGRQLVEGAKMVKIWGDNVAVRAKIHTLGGFSAHAGQSELLAWASNFRGGGPGGGWPRLVLTHGEPGPRAVLAGKLKEMGATSELPLMGSVIEV